MYSVILPTYNEKNNLKPLLLLLHKVFESQSRHYQVVLVDDNSPDGTYDEAIKLQSYCNLEVICRKQKMGLGSAYKEAIKHCKGQYIIVMDADLSHNPEDIKKMIPLIESTNYDIVTGSRYHKNDNKSGVVGWNFMRKLTSRYANNLVEVVLNTNVSDITGSFRAYKKSVFNMLINRVESNHFSYQMEIIYLAKLFEFKIAEVSIIFYERQYGASKMCVLEISRFLASIFWLSIRTL